MGLDGTVLRMGVEELRHLDRAKVRATSTRLSAHSTKDM